METATAAQFSQGLEEAWRIIASMRAEARATAGLVERSRERLYGSYEAIHQASARLTGPLVS